MSGYAPLRDYAALGDGRTVALVSRDGSVDWLCLPRLDSPSVFGALLDGERGGRFMLRPEGEYTVKRRYLPDTNVLETTFSTGEGVVRVTDALTLSGERLGPARELARRIEGLSGRVHLAWHVEPRFRYGSDSARIERRGSIPVAVAHAAALAVCSWDAGESDVDGGAVRGSVAVEEGSRALLALVYAEGEPLVLPPRDHVEERLDAAGDFWREWAGKRSYDGPWRDAVIRSTLALKLLVHAPSGAVAAAPTTSLPEVIGGERNWDYRYAWVRDASFTLDALMMTGCAAEADAFFSWLLHATQLTHPRLHVLYRLDGGVETDERTLALAGSRGSKPIRVGNGAADQLQLSNYGDFVRSVWRHCEETGRLEPEIGKRAAEVANRICEIWRRPDAGIWEVRSEPLHFTHSKISAWAALDRALDLAARGRISDEHVERWRRDADAIRSWVEERCWSERLGAYTRSADGDDLDASVLLAVMLGYSDGRDERFRRTLDAIRKHLGHGPLLLRYTADDGLPGREGAFVACSFWLVHALARAGRADEAAELMDELVALGNDVGLYSEEIDPETGEFLGNVPQGLTHLALIGAATSVAEAGK